MSKYEKNMSNIKCNFTLFNVNYNEYLELFMMSVCVISVCYAKYQRALFLSHAPRK